MRYYIPPRLTCWKKMSKMNIITSIDIIYIHTLYILWYFIFILYTEHLWNVQTKHNQRASSAPLRCTFSEPAKSTSTKRPVLAASRITVLFDLARRSRGANTPCDTRHEKVHPITRSDLITSLVVWMTFHITKKNITHQPLPLNLLVCRVCQVEWSFISKCPGCLHCEHHVGPWWAIIASETLINASIWYQNFSSQGHVLGCTFPCFIIFHCFR